MGLLVLIGGTWDLAAAYDWAPNQPYDWGNLREASYGDCTSSHKPSCE